MLEPRRLRLLRELASRGTIAATAAACGYTPSGVSQQLALLEREVRMPLLVREGRRVALTEAGRVLVDHAERPGEGPGEAMRNRRHLGIGPKLPSGSFAQRCVQSPFDPVRRLTRGGAAPLHWARIFWMVPCSPGVHFGKA